MENSREVLKKFVMSKSKFLEMGDGKQAIGVYLFAEAVNTNFGGKAVNSIRYHFDVGGQELCLDRTSRALASQMANFSEGDKLLIKQFGERNQTTYEIEKLEN